MSKANYKEAKKALKLLSKLNNDFNLRYTLMSNILCNEHCWEVVDIREDYSNPSNPISRSSTPLQTVKKAKKLLELRGVIKKVE